jgi:glycosyltransferase involved in cell wall biosynthesis
MYFRFENAMRAMFWKRYYGQLDAVICMTPDTANRLSDFLGRDTIFCPNPLFKQIDNEVANIDERGKTLDFIAVGRFSQQKRFDLTAQFFKQAQSVFPKARLHFFGDVSKNQMKTALGDNLENVRFHGFADDLWSDVLQQKAPVHLVASDWEDPGHAILEGLHAGVPTVFINADAPYVDFYQADRASLISQGDWDDAQKLKTVIETARAQSVRLHLREQIAGQFTFPVVAQRLQSVLHV